jgi:hypothetical protein
MVGKHQPADFVGGLDVWTFLAEGHLNGSWSPVDEVCHFPLPDSLERLVDLGGVHVSLDDVQNGHVFSLSGGSTDHDILGL